MTPRTGRGRSLLLSDSELITLAVAQVLLGFHSERRWVRHLHAEPAWRELFPYLPQQSGLHRRLKNARPLLCKTILVLAQRCPSWFDDLWMTDATAVPWGMSRETVKRSDRASRRNRTTDAAITELADCDGRIVVTTDRDFRDGHLLADRQRLLTVATGNITNSALFGLFGDHLVEIVAAFDEVDFVELRPTALVLHGGSDPS